MTERPRDFARRPRSLSDYERAMRRESVISCVLWIGCCVLLGALFASVTP